MGVAVHEVAVGLLETEAVGVSSAVKVADSVAVPGARELLTHRGERAEGK